MPSRAKAVAAAVRAVENSLFPAQDAANRIISGAGGRVPRHVLGFGGARCVSGDTVLDGQDRTIAELAALGLPVRVRTTHGEQWAEAPFLKGSAALLTVTTASGKRVEVTAWHRFWDGLRWRPAGSFRRGDWVAVASYSTENTQKVSQKPGKTPELVPVRDYCLTGGCTDDTPNPAGYHTESVVSVEAGPRREQPFYDLHVPGCEHYFANGVLHHNSGKTYLFVRRMVNRALIAPGARQVIFRYRYNHCKATVWLDTLPKVMERCFPTMRRGNHYVDRWADGFVKFYNGSELWFGGLDEKERTEKILGMEFCGLYNNECSQIPWSSVKIALTRLAQVVMVRSPGLPVAPLVQQAYYDNNPTTEAHWTALRHLLHQDPDTRRPLADPGQLAHFTLNPTDNPLLDPAFLAELAALPERERLRFFHGRYGSELAGALWTPELIARCQRTIDEVPGMRRVVIGVDPSGARGPEDKRSEEVGIVAVGEGTDGKYWVLADRSLKDRPEAWGRAVVQLFLDLRADRVFGETNFGGDMVRSTIDMVARSMTPPVVVPYGEAHASRGKEVRAEPVSALYERDMVRHAPGLERLEAELCGFTTAGYQGERSPNRGDACLIAGTLVATEHGPVPIERVRVGDRVWTRQGLFPVIHTGMTSARTATVRMETGAGRVLVGTPEHPVFSVTAASRQLAFDIVRGMSAGQVAADFVPLAALAEGDMLLLAREAESRQLAFDIVRGMSAGQVAAVYNLQVDGPPEFFANGLLVHNCVWGITALATRAVHTVSGAPASVDARGGPRYPLPRPAPAPVDVVVLG